MVGFYEDCMNLRFPQKCEKALHTFPYTRLSVTTLCWKRIPFLFSKQSFFTEYRTRMESVLPVSRFPLIDKSHLYPWCTNFYFSEILLTQFY